MRATDKKVIIVGAGLAGLACARRLQDAGFPFLILEADHRIGGRLKTDRLEGFILNHGFQVLQTAYPEANRVLDYSRLALKPFAPGAIIRIDGRFHRIADPRRHPRDLWSTLAAPIGTMGDRLRIARLALNVRRGNPYIVLNGEGRGLVNSLTVPSIVARNYAPAGQHLISVVVIGRLNIDDRSVEAVVREELTQWFGPEVNDWRHLKTYRIVHALPNQSPPMSDPSQRSAEKISGIYVCGEYGSVPGIQWALLSGRQTAEQVLNDLDTHR